MISYGIHNSLQLLAHPSKQPPGPISARITLQERIDLEDELGIFVDVTFGLDVANRRVIWLFQAIDPETGAPPEGISSGVLPPNPANGTIGQG